MFAWVRSFDSISLLVGKDGEMSTDLRDIKRPSFCHLWRDMAVGCYLSG
jgi:hypothetical protein